MPAKKSVLDALNRLAAAEQQAFAAEFLAPMLRGSLVQIRIAGVVCRLQVRPDDFEGWGVFRATSANTAELLRPARLDERRRYLALLPKLRLILCRRDDSLWLATPASQADRRFRVEGLLPVHLVEEAQAFEAITTRFDGAHCWYDGPDDRRDPALAAYLRDALHRMVEPRQLTKPGISAEERQAYVGSYVPRLKAAILASRDRDEDRLREALAHAGAEFNDYQEQGDVFRVTFSVDGQRHVSAVARRDLSVQVAGICLSGQDRNFDLQSMVGVIREAQDEGAVVRVGPGNRALAEDVYWNVHPPRD